MRNTRRAPRLAAWACAAAIGLSAARAWAQTPSPEADATEQRRLLQRIETERERLEPRPDVHLDLPASQAGTPWPADETPCFYIEHLRWDGLPAEGWRWLPEQFTQGVDTPIGRCLGALGVAAVVQSAQNAVVARGFVTTRVLVEPQDLGGGELVLRVLVGRVGHARLQGDADPRARLHNALAVAPGEPLNLRDLEQSLENLQRLPTVEADIELTPTDQPLHSDVVVRWRQRFPWRLSLSADDAGSRSTGRYQGTATLSRDHGLRLNDLFYLSLQRDLGGGLAGERGTRAATLHYSFPLGRHLLSFTSSAYRYHQRVQGAFEPITYAGTGQTHELQLTRLLHRDADSKTHASLRVSTRESRYFIEDIELPIQHRRTAAWALAVEHGARFGAADVDLDFTHVQGMSALGAQRAAEEAVNQGTARPRLWQAGVAVQRPFAAWGTQWRHQHRLRAQHHDTRLTPPDRFAIGGRHTVRGFDGEAQLSGDSGWTLRQELSVNLGNPAHQLYTGLDRGCVGGPSAHALASRCLTGAVLGLRTRLGHAQAEFFVGWPLRQPEGFASPPSAGGFQLQASF
ncbi:MAG: ShlB/FhaC/HecB family hemolysin secretion/activation protein [Hydrogenophaga sp.]|nr:ShlB/FhaC/HecB family hemolysin secretion/activation protein [Hydrogenophaga sp.]